MIEMDQDKIWSYIQNDAPAEILHKSEGRLEFLARRIKRESKPGARVLNIGVGNGFFERAASRLGMDVYSLDPDSEAIARLGRQPGIEGKAKAGYAQAIPFESDFFDTVVVSEVLEHLSDEILEKALSEIERVLSTGGRVVGTVPARENLSEQLAVCPHCGESFHRWGHQQSFDDARLRGLLERYFKVEEISERRLDAWSRLNWKGKLLSLARQLMLRLGIRGSDDSLYFSAVKMGNACD